MLAQLPVTTYRHGNAPAATAGDGSLCAVCQCDYEEGDRLTHLPCRHAFHRDCVEKWLDSYSRHCPVCKETVCKDLPA